VQLSTHNLEINLLLTPLMAKAARRRAGKEKSFDGKTERRWGLTQAILTREPENQAHKTKSDQ
jgi:hypothetical protein